VEYQPQIRVRNLTRMLMALNLELKCERRVLSPAVLNAGRSDPVWGSELTLFYVPDVTTR
jgi:hypothetical protein